MLRGLRWMFLKLKCSLKHVYLYLDVYIGIIYLYLYSYYVVLTINIISKSSGTIYLYFYLNCGVLYLFIFRSCSCVTSITVRSKYSPIFLFRWSVFFFRLFFGNFLDFCNFIFGSYIYYISLLSGMIKTEIQIWITKII